jgi:hypothetical protein
MNLLPMSIFFILNYMRKTLPKTFTECSVILKLRYLFSTLRSLNSALRFAFLVPLSIRA